LGLAEKGIGVSGDRKYIGAQVRPDSDMYEKFEAYRESGGHTSNSEAVRSLIRAGLEAEEEEDDLGDPDTATEKEVVSGVEIGPLTHSEQWIREKFEGSLIAMSLSATVTLTLVLALVLADAFLTVEVGQWFPTQLLALGLVVGMSVFVVSLVSAVATGILLRTGLASRVEQSLSGKDSAA
jgi:Arc/MetJ-type ribon-helix-helix transcriptional regulator